MAIFTYADAIPLSQDLLTRAIISAMAETDQFYANLPWKPIMGNALAFNRVVTQGDAAFVGLDSQITAREPTKFAQETAVLTTIAAQADISGLTLATQGNFFDVASTQVVQKAKAVTQAYQRQLINGVRTATTFAGLQSLVAASQTITAGANGAPITFALLDALLHKVKDKGGKVDYLIVHSRTQRSILELLRAGGGNNAHDYMTLASGTSILQYRGVPIFINDYVATDQIQGSATECTSVFAGTFDDGSGMYGISGITASNANFGLSVDGPLNYPGYDAKSYVVKLYGGLAHYNTYGLACLKGITN